MIRTKLSPPIERIAVFRALKLGDLLCAVPALRALRGAFPRAEIALVGLPWASEFVDRFDRYLDRFIEAPGYPGLPERRPKPPRVVAFLSAIQAERFDLAIQMHGSGSISNPFVALFGARLTAGFYRQGAYCPDPDLFVPYPDDEHEIRRHLRLVERLGGPTRGAELEFPIWTQDRQALDAIEEVGHLDGQAYACVHAGAGASARCWPAERFAVVADALVDRGLRVVLTGSPEEAGLTRAVLAAMKATAVDLAGRTGLGSLAALVSAARLSLSNDTGVYHLAVAVGTPSVAVSTEPNADRWGPLDRRRHRFLCGGTNVSVEAMVAQADELLQMGRDCASA